MNFQLLTFNFQLIEVKYKEELAEKKEVKQVMGDAVAFKYKYNSLSRTCVGSKEWQDELGLDWYDYGARNYQADLGRWFNVDPLGEMTPIVTPYTFVLNNPVLFTDPDGMRVVAESKEAQSLLINVLTELLGENHGFYFNKKGVLRHRGGKAHRKAKKGYSDEQKAIFDGFTEIASNKEYTIDFFKQKGGDKQFSAKFITFSMVRDENGSVKMEDGKPVFKENDTPVNITITHNKEGFTGGGTFLTYPGSKNAVAIIFPDIAKKRKFKAADGKFTIASMSAIVAHELLDHGLDFIRTGYNDKSSGPSVKNVYYQNQALIIIGSPTRLKHNNE